MFDVMMYNLIIVTVTMLVTIPNINYFYIKNHPISLVFAVAIFFFLIDLNFEI